MFITFRSERRIINSCVWLQLTSQHVAICSQRNGCNFQCEELNNALSYMLHILDYVHREKKTLRKKYDGSAGFRYVQLVPVVMVVAAVVMMVATHTWKLIDVKKTCGEDPITKTYLYNKCPMGGDGFIFS